MNSESGDNMNIYIPKNLNRWNRADPATGGRDNYAGADKSSCYVFLFRSRDSRLLEENNFSEGWEAIKPLLKNEESGIHRFRHWACGWYELILIHESESAALAEADDIAARLEDYPILNEESFSAAEHESTLEYWGNMSLSERLHTLTRCKELFRGSMPEINIFGIRHADYPAHNSYVYQYLNIE